MDLGIIAAVAHHWELSWFTHFFGIDNVSGPFYGFWSGFGSDIGEGAILVGVFSMYRKHNCHVKGCWRIAHHPVEGTPFIVCRKHHPTVPSKGASLEHIHAAHRAANPS